MSFPIDFSVGLFPVSATTHPFIVRAYVIIGADTKCGVEDSGALLFEESHGDMGACFLCPAPYRMQVCGLAALCIRKIVF